MCLSQDKNITPSRSFSNIKGEKSWRISPWKEKKNLEDDFARQKSVEIKEISGKPFSSAKKPKTTHQTDFSRQVK